MTHDSSNFGASILTSVVTGIIVAIPSDAVTYLGKLASVFILAIVAEIGRRLVANAWKDKK